MRSGIYKLTCFVNNKSYIGKTGGDIEKRVMQHLNGRCPDCDAIFNSIQKHGKDNFIWEILHHDILPELLDEFEKQAIKAHNTKAPHGYNLTDGGDGLLNPSLETRQKQSEARKGEKCYNYGKKASEETRRKMSESRRGEKNAFFGKKHTKETRQRISKSNKMRPPITQETRHKKSKTMMGKNRHPQWQSAHDFFLSLPADMDLFEKRKCLSDNFPSISLRVAYNWVHKWQSDI